MLRVIGKIFFWLLVICILIVTFPWWGSMLAIGIMIMVGMLALAIYMIIILFWIFVVIAVILFLCFLYNRINKCP